MREALRDVRPTQFEDLIAIVALYRPGPMQYIPTYARNKKDPASVVYDHEALRPILEPTHGVTIYQEQYMAIARRVGGFTPAQADDLRKAISKKNRQLMATLKEPLMEGLGASGVPPAVAHKLWANFEATGDYSFNKSHAACYALISYRTAWLKANYPGGVHGGAHQQRHEHQGQGAVLREPVPRARHRGAAAGRQRERRRLHRRRGQDPLRAQRREGRRRRRHRGDHRRARASGPFTSIFDFCARVDSQMANKRVLEALIRSGAFDGSGDPRRGMLEALPAAMADGERRRKDAAQGQGGLFDMVGAADGAAHEPQVPQREFDQATLLRQEKEALGLYVSSHPLKDLREQLRDEIEVPVGGLDDAVDGGMLWTGGIVANAQKKVSKNGGVWLAFRLEDIDGGVECRAWPATYEQYRDLLVEDGIVKVKGRVERKSEGETTLIAIEVRARSAA